MNEQEWKARFVARMEAMIGSSVGCVEAASAAYDECGHDHTSEECAEEEVAEWRRSV